MNNINIKWTIAFKYPL